jgi:hypothetical protein
MCRNTPADTFSTTTTMGLYNTGSHSCYNDFLRGPGRELDVEQAASDITIVIVVTALSAVTTMIIVTGFARCNARRARVFPNRVARALQHSENAATR